VRGFHEGIVPGGWGGGNAEMSWGGRLGRGPMGDLSDREGIDGMRGSMGRGGLDLPVGLLGEGLVGFLAKDMGDD
jgi:hypothetical protein